MNLGIVLYSAPKIVLGDASAEGNKNAVEAMDNACFYRCANRRSG